MNKLSVLLVLLGCIVLTQAGCTNREYDSSTPVIAAGKADSQTATLFDATRTIAAGGSVTLPFVVPDGIARFSIVVAANPETMLTVYGQWDDPDNGEAEFYSCREDGSGPSINCTIDGTIEGTRVPDGNYLVSIDNTGTEDTVVLVRVNAESVDGPVDTATVFQKGFSPHVRTHFEFDIPSGTREFTTTVTPRTGNPNLLLFVADDDEEFFNCRSEQSADPVESCTISGESEGTTVGGHFIATVELDPTASLEQNAFDIKVTK